MYTSNTGHVKYIYQVEHNNLNVMLTNDDQQQGTSTFERLFYSYQRYNELRRKDDAIKERFNDLQTKLQELDVLHRSTNEFSRTATPLSRDSGIPVRSSSSCCSLTSESASTPKSSLEQSDLHSPQTSVLNFFVQPLANSNHRHVSVHLNKEASDMSFNNDINSNYKTNECDVHWNNEIFASRSTNQNDHYHSDTNIIKRRGQLISLNSSLPYDSKLNIRIHADRVRCENTNEHIINQVNASATVEPLNDPQYEQKHVENLRKNYIEHYSTISSNDSFITRTTTSSPMQQRESRRDILPRHRQISLPISLPIDQRLYLYIQNGEVLARC